MFNKLKIAFKIKPLSILKWYLLKKILKRDSALFQVYNSNMILDLKTEGISKALAFYGARELDKVELIKEIDLKGKNVLDLGSNIGYYSLILSKAVGKEGHVFCIEPDPRNINILKKNLSFLKSNNTSLHQVAISNQVGKQSLYQAPKSNLSTLIQPKSKKNKSKVNKKTINCVRYKDFINSINNQKIELIRMDIEGYEQYVIPQIIKINPNVKILFEVHSVDYDEEFRRFLNSIKKEFFVKKLVSTQGGKNFLEHDFNIFPYKKVFSDGRYRYFYENIPERIMVDLIMHNPRILRYVLLSPISEK